MLQGRGKEARKVGKATASSEWLSQVSTEQSTAHRSPSPGADATQGQLGRLWDTDVHVHLGQTHLQGA